MTPTTRFATHDQHAPAQPAAVDQPEALPQAMVFFMTVADRARVLHALRAIDTNRDAALLKALGIHGDATAE